MQPNRVLAPCSMNNEYFACFTSQESYLGVGGPKLSLDIINVICIERNLNVSVSTELQSSGLAPGIEMTYDQRWPVGRWPDAAQ